MSCVIGLVHKNKIYFGADSCASSDEEHRIRNDKKLFKHGEIIIGFAGNVRIGQLLKPGRWTPPKQSNIFKLIESIRKHLHKFNVVRMGDEGEEMSCNFLIGYKGKMYEILSDFQIAENFEPYTAIGRGRQVALGSLYETEKLGNSINPLNRIISALECTEKFIVGVKSPFHTLTLSSK